ncbi:Hpt domain-containing protein [Oligoflexus tunisiensis]|uniref:Hpt domain-containing protein n=1 Tax=Oligoflexus tunisiensis TaxID=708132 RepID=UPI001C405AEE|nr:Hpt domain-containing protein [Oligoflexus tunisiensis]
MLTAFSRLGLLVLGVGLSSLALAELNVRDLLSTEKAQQMMLDNPRQLIEVLEPLVTQGSTDLPPQLHLRAARLYAEGLVELGNTARLEDFIPKLQKTLSPSREPEILAENLLVQFLLIQQGQAYPTTEEKEKAFQALRLEADQAGLPAVKARILTRFSIFLTDKGAFLQAMELQNEVQDLIGQASDLPETDQATIKSAMAQLYQRLGQAERSLELMREVLEFSERMQLHYLAATTQLNIGSYHEKQADPEARTRARTAYEAAQSKAQAIDDGITVGASLLGLARISIGTKENRKAIAYLEKALALFTEMQQIVWLGEVYLNLGQALAAAGRHREAEQALENAELYFPPDYLGDHNRILEQRAFNLYALGNKDAAFTALKEHVAVHKKLNNEKFNQDLSQLMVRLGLKVAEDRNAMLLKENELQHQRIEDAERLRLYMSVVLGLSILMMGFLGFSLWSAREVKKSRKKLQRILDNIDEGILTVDRSLRIEPHYSRHVHKIFEGSSSSLAGHEVLAPLATHSSLHPEALTLLRESLQASLGNDMLSWELNSGHVPIEFVIKKQDKDRHISINWVPLMNRGQQIEGFLLGLRDVTARRLLEARVQEEKQKSDRLTRLLSELAQTDRRRAADLLKQVTRLLAQGLESGKMEQFKRDVHTYKGVARSLGLWDLGRFLHALEDRVAEVQQPDSLAALWDELRPTWDGLFHDYGTMLADLLDNRNETGSAGRNLLGLVSQKAPLLADHLKGHGFATFSLTVRDSLNIWPQPIIEILDKVLIHALINAADHGYILTPKGKLSRTEPTFRIEARLLPTHGEVRIMDQGAGLDILKICAMAVKKRIPIEDEASVLEVLFMDGTTTTDSVTITSGRGIGLAAIRSLVTSVQGRVNIENNQEGPGTTLVLDFPASHFIQAAAAA